MSDEPKLGYWMHGVLAGVIMIGAVVVVIATLEIDASWWFGQTGILASFAALAAFVGVAVNVYFARRTLGHARKAEVADRFGKAAELLGNQATSQAGIALLEQVAREAENEYRAAVLATLRFHINGTSNDNEVVAHFRSSPDRPFGRMSTLPAMDRAALQALFSLARIRNAPPSFLDPFGEMIDNRYPIDDLYLHDITAFQADLSQLWIGAAFGDVTFDDCDLSGTRMAGFVVRQVTFRRCNLRGTEMHLYEALHGQGANVRFIDCVQVENATLNGDSVEGHLEAVAKTKASRAGA